MHFMAVKKVQKSFWFNGLFKFTVVKTYAKFQTKFVKGILFLQKVCERGIFSVNNGII